MKYQILLFFIWPVVLHAQPPAAADSGVFLIHKVAQHIGEEKYFRSRSGTITQYQVEFQFSDRGMPVPLSARLTLQGDGSPLSLETRGKSSRFSICNDTIQLDRGRAMIRLTDTAYSAEAGPLAFPVAGYSPSLVQMKMLDFWRLHNRPESLDLIPMGKAKIALAGKDSLVLGGNSIVLDRIMVQGLIWGFEWVWTDQSGQLVCLITNDAEGDKMEMVLAPYESLLPVFIARAATASMEEFARQAGGTALDTGLVVLEGGTIVDVVNKTERPNGRLIIDKGKIISLGDGKSGIPAGPKVRRIQADGKYILPGLWDMHAHFEQAEWGPAYLAAGVTTVRDCGNEFEYINAIQRAIDGSTGYGPRILKAGIIDGNGPMAIGIIHADNAAQAQERIDRYVQNGFVQIKIYSSVNPLVVRAICEYAHQLGLTVTGHVPRGMDILAATDSGMDMINHIQYVISRMPKEARTRPMDFQDTASQRLLRILRARHTVIDPTLGVYEMVYRSLDSPLSLIEPDFYNLPLALQTMFAGEGMPPKEAQPMVIPMNNMKRLVKAMFDLGIPIVAGTDMDMPGLSLHRELELYVQGGMSPQEAIQTATIIPARVMKREEISGSVAEGKLGDLMILDRDPYRDIRNTRSINLVILGGRVYDPATLRRMAGFIR